jgi:lipopolysaccharide transport system ATP-binding protein
MSEIAVSVNNVSKCYRVFENQRSRLLHAAWPAHTKGMSEVWALKDINFEIKRGEAVGIIGRNGGGKSTLLEILTGTLTPTTGSVKVHGRVSALLELGSGFNPEYSGRDNVILNGLLLGLSKEDILSRFSEIEAFAEIGTAIDRPVKTYSSGMMMRLAFAVQVLCDPDILIIDEALSVGDFFFQQKCMSYIRGLCAKGVTLLIVSHDMGTVRDLCTRAAYLRQGCLAWSGEVNAAVKHYLADDQSNTTQITSAEVGQINLPKGPANMRVRLGNTALWQREKAGAGTQILAVLVKDVFGADVLAARTGDVLRFLVWYQAQEDEPVHVSVILKNRYGQVVNCTSSYTLGLKMPSSFGHNFASFSLELRMQLEAGEYSVQFNLGKASMQLNQGIVLDETPWLGPLNLSWNYSTEVAPFLGMFGLPAQAGPPTVSPASSFSTLNSDR